MAQPSRHRPSRDYLYNQRPAWLADAHETLDRAVFAAYGWEYPLTRDQILGRLLKLNHERADSQISST